MAEVRLSSQARWDLFSILDNLGEVAGLHTARRYDTDFKVVIEQLARFPGMGSPRPQLGTDTRLVVVEPYLMLYDGGPKSEIVYVLRILHGHRDITPELIALGRER